jgi:SEC-C motif-containing protein
MDACPCGSGAGYDACCGPFHAGTEPPTALQLMRARYSAFVRRDAAFIIRTSHPLERAKVDMRSLRGSFALAWLGLEIVACERGQAADADGLVHFRARYRGPDGREQVHDERSRFSRAGGAWVYRDGRG